MLIQQAGAIASPTRTYIGHDVHGGQLSAKSQDAAVSPADLDARPASSARPWPSASALTLMVAVGAGLALLERMLRSGWPYWMEDFNVFRMGAHQVLHGGALYHATDQNSGLMFTYTPLAAVLFIPLALGPAGVASVVWCAVEALTLQAAVWLALGAVGVRNTRVRISATVLIAAASPLLDPVDSDLILGQVNLLLMLLVLADLLSANGRRWQGAAIGVAAAIKLIPLLFIVYLALTRRWRAAGTAATVFLLGVGAGFAVLPSDSVEYWWHGAGFDPARVGVPQSPFNQSLRAVFARMMHTSSTANPAWLAAAVLVAVGGLSVAVVLHRSGESLSGAVACALTSTLVSPVAWEHHWVWVVPLLVLLGARAVTRRSLLWAGFTVVVAVAYGLRLLTWFVPVDDTVDLHLNVPQQLAADCFSLTGLVVLAVLAATARRAAGTPAQD
jgi:alpha-1,2-mannosyltransferase